MSVALAMIFFVGHISSIAAQPRPLNRTVLAHVDIRGCKKIESEKLIPLFSVSAAYDSAGFEHSLERMRDIYRNFGFYDFRIDSVHKKIEKEPNQVDAAIYLTEGEFYLLAEIDIKGNKLIPTSELTDLMNTRKGGVLDMDVLEKDFDAILEQYEQIGRPFAKISLASIERIALDKEREIDPSLHIEILIEEGSFMRIAGYKISGNTTTEPEVITRELQFRPGESFNGEKFSQTKQRIEKLGFFEKVKHPGLSALNAGSKGDTLDGIVEIGVVEGNQNTFDGIVGYQPARTSTETGYFTGFVNISLRNMFGTGRQLSVLWNKPTKPSQDIKLRYLEPWLFGIPLNAAMSFRQLKQDTTYSQFDLGLNLSYKITDDFYITAMVSSEAITPIVERESETQLVLKSKKLVTGFGLLYDSRDYPRSPRSGFLFRNEYQIGSKSITSPDSLLDSLGIKKNLTQQR
ncbi:MAG: BamA/TamA family outer membrane protein, partial [Chlorobiales bacterium]|nr:BamA/TamA family outer membrane protein [Chlorobiales bacterium]